MSTIHTTHGGSWDSIAWCCRSAFRRRFGPVIRNSRLSVRLINHHKLRVVCGGAWCSNAWYCRSAFRSGDGPDDRSRYLGFRLAERRSR